MIVVYEDDDARLVQDQAPTGEVILHCKVYRWSSGVYKKLLTALINKVISCKIVYAPAVDCKQIKFMEMFGFVVSDKEMIDQNGEKHSLYQMGVEQWKAH